MFGNASTVNKNQYNGKELQDELGLNITAMDFRQYDNAIGRFNVIDPLTEQDFGNSPYAFAGNNPVLYGDPSGLKMARIEATGGSYKSLAQITDEIIGNHDDEGGGGGGGNDTQALQQQMWGPNFNISGDGFVNSLTTNYQTGESGYWDRRYIGNADPPYTDWSLTINGVTYLPDCNIKPMYEKVWVSDGEKNGLLDNVLEINEKYVDKAITFTNAIILGAKKLGIDRIAESKSFQVFGRVTGLLSLYSTFNKGLDEWDKNKGLAVWHISEAIGQGTVMLLGGEEVEVAYNLSTMAIEATIERFKEHE